MVEYAIVLTTDSYAGNFERELCAHCTGIVGECEVGSEFVEEEITDIFIDIVKTKPDEHGCYRPVSLGCEIPDGVFSVDDVVIWFEDKPSKKLIELIKARANTFDKKIKIKQVHLVEIKTSVFTKLV